jgi:hypothetical protein
MAWLGGMLGRRLGRVLGVIGDAALGYGEFGFLGVRVLVSGGSGERGLLGGLTTVGSWVCRVGLRLPSRRVNSCSGSSEGHRPRRLAYQVVPAPHASVPSSKKAPQ